MLLTVNEHATLSERLGQQQWRLLSVRERHELDAQPEAFGHPGGQTPSVGAIAQRDKDVHVALCVHLAPRGGSEEGRERDCRLCAKGLPQLAQERPCPPQKLPFLDRYLQLARRGAFCTEETLHDGTPKRPVRCAELRCECG